MTEIVKERIIKGEYTTRKHVAERAGKFWRIMNEILDENNTVLKKLYYCRACASVLECTAATGTIKLNRHADRCDPLPGSSKTHTIGEYYDFFFVF